MINNKNDDAIAAATDSADSVYGGYHYRLTYDRYENSSIKNRKNQKIKLSSVITCIIISIVFFSLGLLIFKYYNYNVDKIYSDSEKSENLSSAEFQVFFDNES